MCGIAGFWSPRLDNRAHAVVTAMASRLAHRGPDDEACWVDRRVGVALAHRRLSIVDLSPAGRQPMASASGRVVVSFNGEIYNHDEIRRDLLRSGRLTVPLRGHSDTEVLVEAVDAWGLAAALKRFVGMFAFALWDSMDRELYLVRDRLGVKPLYYGWAGRSFVFASELKALAAHPDFDPAIDRGAVALLLRHACIPAPHSIFNGVRKLLPGTILRIRSPLRTAVAPVPYWSARDVAVRGLAEPFDGTPEEAATELERLLADAVALRMTADVPIGAFLSGGIDSSTVTALMQAQSARPVKTFTIGSADRDCDESASARAVARCLGTDHTELHVTPRDALAVIPQLPSIFDEPFADSSQIPTYLVSALARRHVTVALSGDGGDELFGGYNRHLWGRRLWAAMRRVPPALRAATARAVVAVPPEQWTGAFRTVERVLPRRWHQRAPGDKLHKLAGILASASPQQLYDGLASRCPDPCSFVRHVTEPVATLDAAAPCDDLTTSMLYLDLVGYLPNDILTKVDRASMACSLEARGPFLDHRVVEFAWRLPLDMKIRGGTSKWPLRQILYRHVPRRLIDRPKSGFGLPIGRWLAGPLRAWAEDLLEPHRLTAEGFFDTTLVQQAWSEHLSGRTNRVDELWSILMFQAWHRALGERAVPSPLAAAHQGRDGTLSWHVQ